MKCYYMLTELYIILRNPVSVRRITAGLTGCYQVPGGRTIIQHYISMYITRKAPTPGPKYYSTIANYGFI